MIVHYDSALQPQSVITFASHEYVAWLREQPDALFVDLAEDWPIEEIALDRGDDGRVRAFHVPPGGSRREIAQRDANPATAVPFVRDVEAERASLAARVDAFYGQQAQLRYPLAALHAAKARAGLSTPEMLAGEAAQRGVETTDLVSTIQDKATAQDRALLALDAERLALKREVARAETLTALDAIAARIGG